MIEYFGQLSEVERSKIKRVPFPTWYPPMLATLTSKRFSDPTWLYEPKFDGERALTFYNKQTVNIFSRNQINLNGTYPELVNAFDAQTHESFIVDGEIVAFDKDVTSFSKLQQRIGVRKISLEEALKIPVYYYLFDILYLNGFDLRDLPLRTRKLLLKEIVTYKDPLRLTEGKIGEGEIYYREACKNGWEGIIAKGLESTYQGKRSADWLKFKCSQSQELIILGYTAPKGKRQFFGALLVGYYDKGILSYAGKVGTGFSTHTLMNLKKEMDKYISSQSLIDKEIKDKRPITWLKPILVGEFCFTEWTREGKLRHPRFKGLRYDKEPNDVTREIPQ